MRVSDEMVEMAASAYWNALPDGLQAAPNRDALRAALEAALEECEQRVVFGSPGCGEIVCDRALVGKRVALVPVDE